MPDAPAVQVAMMRHARTLWNEEGRIQGWLDSPLSDDGCQQVRAWAESMVGIPFDRIVCSDLGRAVETAGVFASYLGLPVVTDSRFRERCFGVLEGGPSTSLAGLMPEQRPNGGETLNEVRNRAMEGLLALSKERGDRNLLVTHQGVLQCVLGHLAGPAYPLYEGRLLKSRRLHWVGVTESILGVVELNGRMRPE